MRRRPNFVPTSTILLLGWRTGGHKPTSIPRELFLKMGGQFNTLGRCCVAALTLSPRRKSI